ncbi:MAG: hypothetical protein KBC30_09520 [Planctomycetes bacterium]|nr:hypothetical protein [Planctomycetota bacterium]
MSLIKEDHLFGKIAVLNNFITEAQLEEAIQIQLQRKDTLASLPLILLNLGYITNEQFRDILETQKRRMPKPAVHPQEKRDDLVFAYLAVKNNYVEEEEIYQCLTAQSSLAKHGLLFRLSELLVAKYHMTLSQAEKILLEQDSLVLSCSQCGLRYNMLGLQTPEFTCKRCGLFICISPRILKDYNINDMDSFQNSLQSIAQEKQATQKKSKKKTENIPATFQLIWDGLTESSEIPESSNEDLLETDFSFGLNLTETSTEKDTDDISDDDYILAGTKGIMPKEKQTSWLKHIFREHMSSQEEWGELREDEMISSDELYYK